MSLDQNKNHIPLIKIESLKKHFSIGKDKTVHAVDGVDLEIYPNEIVGLVGESGCGKSTLGRTLAGLYEKTGGRVFLKGQELPQKYKPQDFLRLSREIQMIFQDPYSSLNPRMTVREIIAEGPRLTGIWDESSVTENVNKALHRVGLATEHASRYPHEFSGGQRQRIGIARALAMEPQFIICDEPISALDVSIQAQIINLLAELKSKFGLTLLFIAHDLSMVRFVSDRMAVMYLGSIVEIGRSDDVFFKPLHPYTQLLLSSNPEPDPKSEKVRVQFEARGEIPTPINLGEGCRFASRCPKVVDRCRQVTPKLEPKASTQFVACHLVEK